MAENTAHLLSPVTFDGLLVPNRVWLAPMCQYSVDTGDGMPNEWHFVHLGARAQGGFGLIVAEATAVCPQGRISPHDTGLWSDDHVAAWAPIVDFCHRQGVKVGVQLGHAGRKASTHRNVPGQPRTRESVAVADGGWETVAPSALAYPGLREPRALTVGEVEQVVEQFAQAAVRAQQAGFDVVQIHGAHGYLVHEFMSPLSNDRDDEYGGDSVGRARFLSQIVQEVRSATGGVLPVGVRVSATDWLDGGLTPEETAHMLKPLVGQGLSWVDVSTGALLPADIPVGPGYQVDAARVVREQTGLLTSAVGLITEPVQAQEVLVSGAADAVSIGRAGLREPNWPWRAAAELGLPQDGVVPGAYWQGRYPTP